MQMSATTTKLKVMIGLPALQDEGNDYNQHPNNKRFVPYAFCTGDPVEYGGQEYVRNEKDQYERTLTIHFSGPTKERDVTQGRRLWQSPKVGTVIYIVAELDQGRLTSKDYGRREDLAQCVIEANHALA